MAVQFQHVFTGKRMGVGEIQGESGVQHRAIGVAKGQIFGHARRRQMAQQGLGDLCHGWPGDPHDAHAPPSGGGGQCGDGVGGGL